MRISVLAIALVGIALHATCTNAQSVPAKYNGSWWLTEGDEAREGFVDGFLDCYTHDYKGLGRWSLGDTFIRDSVTQLISSAHGTDTVTLSEALLSTQREHALAPRASSWRFGGDAWAEMTQEGRLGYLEGYFYCHQALVPPSRSERTYSRDPSEYREQITKWYHLDLSEGNTIPEALARVQIRDVLARFADRSSP